MVTISRAHARRENCWQEIFDIISQDTTAKLKQIQNLSCIDARLFFDDQGLKHPIDWTEDMGKAVQSFKIIRQCKVEKLTNEEIDVKRK